MRCKSQLRFGGRRRRNRRADKVGTGPSPPTRARGAASLRSSFSSRPLCGAHNSATADDHGHAVDNATTGTVAKAYRGASGVRDRDVAKALARCDKAERRNAIAREARWCQPASLLRRRFPPDVTGLFPLHRSSGREAPRAGLSLLGTPGLPATSALPGDSRRSGNRRSRTAGRRFGQPRRRARSTPQRWAPDLAEPASVR
jgi:hypothetical protein